MIVACAWWSVVCVAPVWRYSVGRALLSAASLLCLLPDPALTQGLEAGAGPEAPLFLEAPAETDRRMLGWSLVGGSYATMGAYAFYSWYDSEAPRSFFFHDEGWFGGDTYAGGADKVGHFFSSYVITRAGYDVLAWAGVPRDRALSASIALDALFFTAIEVKDGFTEKLGFSWGDFAANFCGSLLAAAFVRHPSLDRALDVRLQYYPSREYLDTVNREGSINAVEDYTGMTFGLWYHLGEIPGLERRAGLAWLRYFDVGVTYGSRYYRPRPAQYREPERQFSAALGLNLGQVARSLAGGRLPGVVKATDWVFEYFTVPGTTLSVR